MVGSEPKNVSISGSLIVLIELIVLIVNIVNIDPGKYFSDGSLCCVPRVVDAGSVLVRLKEL